MNNVIDKSDFVVYLFGTSDYTFVLSGLIFAMIGVFLSNLLQGDIENKDMVRKTNHNRLIISILVVIITLRFSTEFIGGVLTMWWAFIIGLASDKIVEIFIKIKNGASPTDAIGTAFTIKKNGTDNVQQP